jgi:opacity protein-like surface antigen
MKKLSLLAAAGVAALTMASGAQAQTAAQPYIGLSAGYHDTGVSGAHADDGAIIGVVGGVDFPVAETLTFGVEGNYHIGTNAIDSEYGIAARLGFPVGANSQLFVKGGYQEVNFDLNKLTGLSTLPSGLDDTDGDYLVGVGGEFGLGSSPARLRVGVDTIAFDTVRATAGVVWKF